MISQYLQNFSNPAKGFHSGHSSPVISLRSGIATPLVNLVGRLRAVFVEIDARRRVAYENRKAIAHLETLSDAQLRDVGIGRHDIERCVRRGRETI